MTSTRSASPGNPGAISAHDLERSLESPLRLRLVADLLDRGAEPISLDEAVVHTSRHFQDVLACLGPMVRWGVVDELEPGRSFRLHPEIPPKLLDALHRGVEHRSALLSRERRVRYTILAGMIGTNPKMQLVFEMIRQVCRIDVPVLITGETGTGKELVARAIHDLGSRRCGFFGAVNCATLTENLFESQLFGHVRGAFTGAVRDQTGLVERCDKGTLFLDEVGDLKVDNQVKLLRVLQEGTFSRLGDTNVRRSDFRLVAATNRDMGAMVKEGTFREDLFYRLNVFPIRLPSLRERLDDLPYLVAEILKTNDKHCEHAGQVSVSAAALHELGRHSWPGNIRQLENVIVRAAIMARGGTIEPEHLPDLGAPAAETAAMSSAGRAAPARLLTLEEVERQHVACALQRLEGNIRQVAAALGVTRATVYKKIKKYGLEQVVPEHRAAAR